MVSPMQPVSFAAARRQLARRAAKFAQYSDVFQHVSGRMLERLELLAAAPERVLDLGCRNGYQMSALQALFPNADIFGLDFNPNRTHLMKPRLSWIRRKPENLKPIACNPEQLPFDDGAFDLVVSNLLLPWCQDPARIFSEVARVLRVDGAFLFTTAGPDTLVEYAQAWSGLDGNEHRFGLEDMHQIGDALLRAGFAAPVLDRENIMVDYPSIDALQSELQHLGAGNIAIGRRSGLMSPDVRTKLAESVSTSRFNVTLELVQGHGWKGELRHSGKNTREEVSVSLESLRRSLRSGQ